MKRILAGLLISLWSSLALANVPCTLPFNLEAESMQDQIRELMAKNKDLEAQIEKAKPKDKAK